MTVSKTKAKLVDVARQLFAKMGVENTTMNDIALASKKGRRTLYTYFKSKEDIYLAVVESELDILSDMNLKELYDFHLRNGSVATLLASRRKTSRYLLFDAEQRLCGWINKDTGQVRPEGFLYDESLYREYAFSGIHVFSLAVFQLMEVPCWEGKFSIMDFYLATCGQTDYCGYLTEKLELIDIGKPETLARAEEFLRENIVS